MIKPTSKMMSSSSSSVKSSSTSFKMVLNLSTGMNPSPSMSNNLGENYLILGPFLSSMLSGIDGVQKTIKKPPAHSRGWQGYKSQDLLHDQLFLSTRKKRKVTRIIYRVKGCILECLVDQYPMQTFLRSKKMKGTHFKRSITPVNHVGRGERWQK